MAEASSDYSNFSLGNTRSAITKKRKLVQRLRGKIADLERQIAQLEEHEELLLTK